jgi:hypothetical protein
MTFLYRTYTGRVFLASTSRLMGATTSLTDCASGPIAVPSKGTLMALVQRGRSGALGYLPPIEMPDPARVGGNVGWPRVWRTALGPRVALNAGREPRF